jgi:6-phosphogluconolactonase (cycloisomerase 2 family)
MIENPAGTLLFMIDSTAGNPQIDVFQVGSGGVLTQVGVGTPLPSGFQPFNLAVDGLGKYLYVSNVSSSSTTQIMAFTITNGALSTVPGSPFSSNLTQMQGDPSGQFMIGTTATLNNADPNIWVWGITQSGANAGAITLLGSAATANSPNSVVVQPNSGGTKVYAFNLTGGGIGGPVEGYTLNPSTGALTIISGSPFAGGGDAGQFDQAGKFLFVRDLFAKQMTVFDVTTNSGALTTSVASQTWDSDPWAWAVTDPN